MNKMVEHVACDWWRKFSQRERDQTAPGDREALDLLTLIVDAEGRLGYVSDGSVWSKSLRVGCCGSLIVATVKKKCLQGN